MKIFSIVLIVTVLLFVLFLFLIFPAVGRKKKCAVVLHHAFAHRGLFSNGEGIPENSLEAFRRAVENGYGIETDVHLTADGQTVLHHDDSLLRMCGKDVFLREMTAEEVTSYRLLNTDQRIPRFSELLRLVDGKVPLVIELKAERGNQRALAERVLAELKGYEGAFCIESFDPRVLREVKRAAPEIIRGQLSGRLRRCGAKLHSVTDFALRNLLTNVLSRPDFIAYRFEDRNVFAFRLCTSLLGAERVYWTIRTPKALEAALHDGGFPIFEGMGAEVTPF